ncbi:hypothetical protein C8Q72DRAFT_640660 [Fomitopsis betulina]|nr:hypothetical protein C8Q72DRAFT_640660 [Fomitopsis betulina]
MKRGFLKKGLETERKARDPTPELIGNASLQILSTPSIDKGPNKRSTGKDAPVSTITVEAPPPAKTDTKGGHFRVVCPADRGKREQPGVIATPCYCTYSADGEEPSLLMIAATPAELEEVIPFAEAALRKPLPPQGPHPFRISAAGEKGLGMFATRAIKAGELIIAERPLVISSQFSSGTKYRITYARPFYDAALAALSEPARAALLELADSCSLGSPELTHPLPGRIMTNAYSCGPLTATNAILDLPESVSRGTDPVWHATYATLAHANHACTPNAHYSWNRVRWCGQFYAARDIAAGAEITTTYTMGLTQAERQAHLEEVYSCRCRCESCVGGSGQQSDGRRLAVDHYKRMLEDALDPKDYPVLNEEEIRRTLRWAREEGMMMHQANILWDVARIMQVQENALVGLRWAKEARKSHVLVLGEELWLVAQIDSCGRSLAEKLRALGVACQWP